MQLPNNFNYPLLPEWNTEEIIVVTDFYQIVELIYTSKVNRADFLEKYNAYQNVVPMKMDQKKIDQEFFLETGMSIYKATKFVQNNNKQILHL